MKVEGPIVNTLFLYRVISSQDKGRSIVNPGEEELGINEGPIVNPGRWVLGIRKAFFKSRVIEIRDKRRPDCKSK